MALGALLAFWALAWLVVPPLARAQLQKIASEQLGRQVSIERIDFRPWSLELALEGLRVAAADGGAPQLAVRRIYIDAELQSLLRWAPVVDAVRIESPRLRLHHLGGGRYDIDDLLARFAPRPDAAPASPARFALYNLALTDGSLDLQDDAVGRTHTVRALEVGLPFLSNLPSQREVKVLPHLAFVLNGSQFDSGAEATPFAQRQKADATLRLTGLDVAPYLGYLPAALPVRLQAARLDGELTLAFEQAPAPTLRLGGRLQVSGARLADRAGAEVLAFDRLAVELADVRPLERIVRLASVTLDAPVVRARRNAQGHINLTRLAAAEGLAAAPAAAASAPASAASAPSGEARAPAGWLISVARVAVQGGILDWQDAATRQPAHLALEHLSIEAEALAWPVIAPARLKGSARLAGAELAFQGEGTDLAAQLQLSLTGLPLQQAAPYLDTWLEPRLTGTATAELTAQWAAPALVLELKALAIDNLALTRGAQRLAGWRKLELAQARVDLARHELAIGRLALTQPQLRLERERDGRWQAEAWLRAPASAREPAAGAAAAAATRAGAAPAWSLQVAELALDGGALAYADRSRDQPVELAVSALRVRARNVSPTATRPSPLQLSARVASGSAEAGQFSFDGSVTAGGPAAQGRIVASALPVHAFAPYLADVLNVELLRARAGFRGQLRYAQDAAGLRLQVLGDASLDDLRANTARARRQAETTAAAGQSAGANGARAAERPRSTALLAGGDELLNWKTLALRGLAVDMAPGKATRVDVRETALTDFYANVSISETGRINLQHIVRRPDAAPASASASASASVPAGAASAAPKPGPAATAADGKLPARINFGPIVLRGGRVLFADHFVRPNYSADLSELNGRLGAFSSAAAEGGPPQMAELELRGRAEGTATLEITGRLNPLAQPLALDVQGKVRDLELPPLSPYSVKYAGHGIERGKLSVDVAYKVQPDGQLTASNRLVLHQLSFGEPVAGAPASLPVRLAVALLADRNGVIDVDLPISGSLNDPQFSLGPVIFKVIVNLIVKAVTAPFSLLAGLGGGADELSAVGFQPGTARLEPGAQAGLDKIAKALADRPALRLTVVGTASPQDEQAAWQRARLAQLVLAEKRRAATVAGRDPQTVAEVTPAEYPALLKEVYRRADMRKPRNLVGLQRDLPVTDMEALLLAQLAHGGESMRELAVQRAVVVRDYLAARQLPPDRLFLGAPRLVGESAARSEPAAASDAAARAAATAATRSAPPSSPWTPRAELTLGTR